MHLGEPDDFMTFASGTLACSSGSHSSRSGAQRLSAIPASFIPSGSATDADQVSEEHRLQDRVGWEEREMKMNVWSSTLAAMTIVTGAAVTAAQQPTTSATSSQHSDKDMVTVTGCLQEGASGGSASSSNSSKHFILANAKMSSGSSSTSSSSTPTTSSTAPSGTSYVLDGSSTELRPHVNHEVQITGRLDNKGSSSSSTSSGPKINVESVRMVAQSCSSR